MGSLYAVALGNAFGRLDPQAGAFVQLGTLAGIQNGTTGAVGDLARLPGGTLYGIQGNEDLVTIDPVAVASTLVGNVGSLNLFAIKFRSDGVLFGASLTDLYTINPKTAQTTHVGSFGISTAAFGYFDLAIDANGNVFLQVSYPNSTTGGTLYSVNSSTGAATQIGSIGFLVAATEFVSGTLYGFTACPTIPCPTGTASQVLTINPATGAGTVLVGETPQGVEISAAAPAGP
jgi:hypothetical protein